MIHIEISTSTGIVVIHMGMLKELYTILIGHVDKDANA